MKTALRKAFPELYQQLAKMIQKPDAWQQEKRRLLSLNRYTEGCSMILGKKLSYSDNLSFIATYEEIFQQEQYKFKASNARPIILDIGANIGVSVLYFKQLYPNAQITALEPDPNLFALLTANLKHFGYSDITLYQIGVWKKSGNYSFLQDYGTSGHLMIGGEEGETNSGIKVTMQKLSDFLQQPLDLLKIDIEGAEWDCLKESAELLGNCKQVIIEHHTAANKPSTLHQLLALLQHKGFRYYIREAYCPKHPLYSINNNGMFDLQVNIFATQLH